MYRLKAKNPTKSIKSKVMGGIAGMNAIIATAMLTHAADLGAWATAGAAVKTAFDTLQNTLEFVVVPIAGCALVACLIMMLVSQNQRKVEAYRSWCITIVICIVAIYAVPFIIGLAESIGSSFNI